TGVIQQLAWQIPEITQGILALNFIRLILLFLIFRRLMQPQFQWQWIVGLLLAEIMFGFTRYFAGFREPLMIAALALLEAFDRRKVRQWLAFSSLAAVISLSAIMWTAIKPQYRQDFESTGFAESRVARLGRVAALASRWTPRNFDELV